MAKMNMRKIEDTTKRMEGEDSLIEMRYKATMCCHHRDRPSSHILVTSQGNYPNYNEFFTCKSCADWFDEQDCYEWDAQGIVGVYDMS